MSGRDDELQRLAAAKIDAEAKADEGARRAAALAASLEAKGAELEELTREAAAAKASSAQSSASSSSMMKSPPPSASSVPFAAEVRSLKGKLETMGKEKDALDAELAMTKKSLQEAESKVVEAAESSSSSSSSSSLLADVASPVAKSMADSKMSLMRMEVETRNRELAEEREARSKLEGDVKSLRERWPC